MAARGCDVHHDQANGRWLQARGSACPDKCFKPPPDKSHGMVQLSGERIITMEWMNGCKLTDMEALRDLHLHSRDVAIELLHAFAQMTFVDGFGARSC